MYFQKLCEIQICKLIFAGNFIKNTILRNKILKIFILRTNKFDEQNDKYCSKKIGTNICKNMFFENKLRKINICQNYFFIIVVRIIIIDFINHLSIMYTYKDCIILSQVCIGKGFLVVVKTKLDPYPKFNTYATLFNYNYSIQCLQYCYKKLHILKTHTTLLHIRNFFQQTTLLYFFKKSLHYKFYSASIFL